MTAVEGVLPTANVGGGPLPFRKKRRVSGVLPDRRLASVRGGIDAVTDLSHGTQVSRL